MIGLLQTGDPYGPAATLKGAPPFTEKLKGSPTSWLEFEPACLQTLNSAADGSLV